MDNKDPERRTADVLVYGATAGGVAAAVAAARAGCRVMLVERGEHVGGVATAGLHMIDILRKNATGGICREHIGDVRDYYVNTYGQDSEQYRLTFGGYWAEPHAAQKLFQRMLDDEDRITLLKRHELRQVLAAEGRVTGCVFDNRDGGRPLRVDAAVTIDATYEADVAAAAGVDYRVGREARGEYDERFAGKVYYDWRYNRQCFLPVV